MSPKVNQHHSYTLGGLSKGCQYCVRGEKLVLFVTGLCPRKCYFCPVSDEKFQKDVAFANERKVFSSADVVKEAEKMNAKGAGITGGDPLVKIDRTTRFIINLKKKFGMSFHIHLYTSLKSVNDSKLQKLYAAGLDEIRFHPDLESQQFWKRITIAAKFPWDIGIEVPIIPGKEKETKELIDFVNGKVSFLNLNELEVADNKQSKLLTMGFKTKGTYDYAIANSLEMGLNMLNYVQDKEYNLKVHLCTAKLKDATQLTNRIKREAKCSKRAFDLVDKEGMLTRGALYLEDLSPGFGYREKLKNTDKVPLVAKLNSLLIEIKDKTKMEDEDLFIDEEKVRILLSKSNVKKNKKQLSKLNLLPAIVTEYPTADQLEIEVQFLSKHI
jgi:uncharacterized protein